MCTCIWQNLESHTEKTFRFDDLHNGIFLGTLESSHYGPFTDEHLEKQKAKAGTGPLLTHHQSGELGA